MSFVPIFQSIRTRLLATITNKAPFNVSPTDFFNPAYINPCPLYYIQLWNNQVEAWKKSYKDYAPKTDEDLGLGSYDVQFPAVMVEFQSTNDELMGKGVMIFPDLKIIIHVCHYQLDAGDGTMEQNLEVFQLADAIHFSLEKFIPTGCNELIRKTPRLDYKHTGLYHYILEYETAYVDALCEEPEYPQTADANPGITVVFNPSPFLKPLP